MQIIPAIDLKDNKCVRLKEGKDKTSVIFNDSPEKQAIYFEEIGCEKIHIVDLDSAFGRANINLPSIIKIRKSITIPIQLGGGIRKEEDAIRYFDLGIDNIIIGSMSINYPRTVMDLCNIYKNKIYVALDIKDNNVMIKGWKEKSNLKIDDVLKLYNESEIKGYVITDIKNDGMLKGLDINFIKDISKRVSSSSYSSKKIIIAGGLTDYDDIRSLKNIKDRNIEGIISGKSFYVGNIDLIKAQEILNSDG